METISVTYSLVWQFKEYPHLKITKCKKVFNCKTGKQLKQTINGGSIGFWIASKLFVPTSKINSKIEKIPIPDCPF
jgi:hypothetical protein